jgi:hypothetical protein
MWFERLKASTPTRSRVLVPALAGMSAIAVGLALQVPALRLGLLFLAPALLLFLLLAGGADPAPLLVRARRRGPSRRRRGTSFTRPRAPKTILPRGGELLASFLAGRAPPALPA